MAVNYGFLCEDKALELFIEEVLKKFGPVSKCKAFEKDKDFALLPTSATNRREVIAQYKDAAKKAISINNLDLFIASYDWDDAHPLEYETSLRKQVADINGKARNRTVMCVPVKCVEYWLYYIKHWDDELMLQANSLENDVLFNGNIAKSNVYERSLDEKGRYPKQSASTEISKARIILEKLDIERLKALSPSFAFFVTQLINFCNNHA